MLFNISNKRILLVILLSCYGTVACSSDKEDETHREIRELKAEVKSLARDVHDLEKATESLRHYTFKEFSKDAPIVPKEFSPDDSHLDDPFLGPKDAEVIVMAFSDYQCKPCRSYFEKTFHKLKDKFFDTDKVKYVFRDFPLAVHEHALWAATLAHCAGEQGRYWHAHDTLFENPKALDSGKLDEIKHALKKVKLDKLDRCLESQRYKSEIQADIAEGKKLGAKGAPCFFIGKKASDNSYRGAFIRGAQPFPVLRAEISKLL